MMDCDRNEGEYAESILRLSGQGVGDWPDGEPLTTPCSETCCNLFRHGGTAQIQGAITEVVASLIRGKSLECARHRGHVCIAVDGVEQEVTRVAQGSPTKETRFQLEAKVIAPNGLALSVMTERVRPHVTETGKRDCELNAFKRLAKRLRKAFPRLPVCIVGDALYACAPVMRICRGYGWKFILTFREGRSPGAYEMACDSMQMSKGQCGELTVRGENERRVAIGLVAWTGGVKFTTQADGEEFNVVACEETKGGTYRGMFATNYDAMDADRASEIVAWGRRRWNIEINFKDEKHNGFGLEHLFCNHWRCSRNFHLMMQLANNLWQLFNACVVPKIGDGCRKMAQYQWTEIVRRVLHDIGVKAGFESMPRRYVRRMDC